METFKNTVLLLFAAIAVFAVYVAASADAPRRMTEFDLELSKHPLERTVFGDYSCVKGRRFERDTNDWHCVKFK